jgi:hypothetical protein
MIEFFTPPIPSGIALWLVLVAPLWAMLWWMNRRAAADKRHWDLQRRAWDLQRQVWDMERQIWDERRSDEERERERQVQARVAEIRREARRRLGLPEEG